MSEPERACDERALLFLAFRDGLDGNSLNLHRSFVGTVCGNNVQIVRGARLITVLSRDGRVHLPTHIELLAARDACFSKSLSGLHEGKCFGLETRFWKVALPFRLSVWLTAANRLFVSMALLEAQEMALISRVKLSATGLQFLKKSYLLRPDALVTGSSPPAALRPECWAPAKLPHCCRPP
jgi:hypothetical protein